jgi:hypothetical protein
MEASAFARRPSDDLHPVCVMPTSAELPNTEREDLWPDQSGH